MVQKSENRFRYGLCKKLREEGVFVISIAGSWYTTNGTPDTTIIDFGRIYLIEWKGKTTPLEPLQESNIKQINLRRPFTAFVVRDPGIIEYHTRDGKREVVIEDITAPKLLAALKEFQ